MESGVARCWRKLHQPRAYFTVEPILLVFMFASFLSYSAFQQLVHRMVCQQTLNCSDHGAGEKGNSSGGAQECSVISDVEQTVQSRSSHWLLYVNLASGLPSIFLSMIYGSLSDRLGRKIFIALPPIGSIVNTAVILLVFYLEDTLPIAFFLLGAFASGIFGNFSVLNFGVYSYASDISAHSRRTVQIGVLESMTYLGATLSLLIGGVWIKSGNFGPPFWFILGCQLAVISYIVVFLPESLRSGTSTRSDGGKIQQKDEYRRRQSCAQLLKSIPYNLFNFGKMVLGNWRLLVLMLTFFVVEINFLGITDIVILYAIGEPLCWTSVWIGYFLALKVFLNGLAALVLLPVLVYVRVPDTLIIIAGLIAGAASLVMMGVAVKTWIMFIVPMVAAMRGCVVPVIRSMLSKNTPPDKQGILFSGVGVVESTCTMAASVIYNALYPATRQVHHGFCFFLMAGALVIPFVLILILHFKRGQSHDSASDVSDESSSLLQPSTSYNST